MIIMNSLFTKPVPPIPTIETSTPFASTVLFDSLIISYGARSFLMTENQQKVVAKLFEESFLHLKVEHLTRITNDLQTDG